MIIEQSPLDQLSGTSGLIYTGTQFSIPLSSTFYNWSVPTGNATISGSGNTVTVTLTGNGNVNICVAVSNGQSYCSTVHSGVPDLATKIAGVIIPNAYPVTANYIYQLEASPNKPGTTFNFSDNGGSGDMTIFLNSFGNPVLEDMYVNSNSTYGDRVVKVTATNACGSVDQYITFYLSSGMFRAYPNPAKSDLTFAFTNTQSKETLPTEISLFSEKSTIPVITIAVWDYFDKKMFKDGDKINLDVSNLPRGTYHIHVKKSHDQENTTERRRLILE